MARWFLKTVVLASALAVHISAVSLHDSPQQKMEKRARRERQAAQWAKGFYSLTSRRAQKYDYKVGTCCYVAMTKGIRPHETWGNATQEEQDWFVENQCENLVGAGVLAVGIPVCDYFISMKQGYESLYLRNQEYDAEKVVCSDSDREILNGTRAEQATNDSSIMPAVNLLADREVCIPSRMVLSSGRGVNTTNLAGCIKSFPHHEGLSEPCLAAWTGLLHNVVKGRSVDTFRLCLDICDGVDTCVGMEKCVKKAAECSRCIEPALYKFKHQFGGHLEVQPAVVQPDLFMRVVMGFEKRWDKD